MCDENDNAVAKAIEFLAQQVRFANALKAMEIERTTEAKARSENAADILGMAQQLLGRGYM